MSNTTGYIFKAEKKNWKKFKKKTGDLPMGFHLRKWVEHLADQNNFDKAIQDGILDFTSNDSFLKREARYKEEIVPFKVVFDADSWARFLDNCKVMNASGMYVLNTLVEQYVKRGYLFKISINV